ncbi:MAG: DUF3179 domain-containing protein [Acidimicrobiales bacterium]|nr:DUF3179 domain-containing protein [Acidimicrobiales bacterium]
MRFLALIVAATALATACAADQSSDSRPEEASTIPPLPPGQVQDFGEPPELRAGPLAPEVVSAIAQVFGPSLEDGFFDVDDRSAFDTMGASGDVRVAWLLSDLLRFVSGEDTRPRIARAASDVMGRDLDGDWRAVTDHLIAWDVPAPPNYFAHKKLLYTLVSPAWEPFFDETSTVDWRLISWGGVFIDDQPFNETSGDCQRCIPAIDNPIVTDAAGGGWYPDERVVFGVEINGEARAYPKHIMEIRELVNDSLGERDFGMPYCTLCGAAQVFFTDEVDGFDRPILRTSGLLSRSNKVMFDLNTKSVFDTFLGEAVTGPLADAGVVLPQANVVTTTWGAWKAEHPNTTILAEELDLGRGFDPLRGRDDDGPIFPIGEVDSRLPAQEKVLGVISPETGQAIAFHVVSAVAFLANGETIDIDGISIVSSGSGVEAVNAEGDDLGGHEAFWFAWSQFNPATQLWPPS